MSCFTVGDKGIKMFCNFNTSLYLTAKQKEQKQRAEASLAALAAQGIQVPKAGEKRGPRPGTRIRPNKKKHDVPSSDKADENSVEVSKESSPVDENKPEDVKESWDAEEDVKESWEEVVAEDTKKVEEPPKEVKKEEKPAAPPPKVS